MKRLTVALLALLWAACGKDKPAIQSFVAAPANIELGGSAQLIFGASAGARLGIDQGVGDVTGKTSVDVSPATTTTYTLTASKDGNTATATATVTVGPARASAFTITQSSDAVAGLPASFVITAVDPGGGVNLNYRGTVHLTTDDSRASLPPDFNFTAADAGKRTVAATFKGAGRHTLVVADAAAAGTQGVLVVSIAASSASKLVLAGVPSSATAGDRLGLTVTALDAFGNVAMGYTGTVHFTSNDATAQLPADVAYAAADAGVRSFAVVFTQAGSATVEVSGGGGVAPAVSPAIAVDHGPAKSVGLQVSSEATSDEQVSVTATVRDAYGNTVTDYAGTLHFITTDDQAGAIADVVFTAAMGGSATFQVSFATAGEQSIIATDTAAPSLGGSTAVKVKHGGAVAYLLSPLPSGAVAGEPLPLTIAAVDPRGNVVDDYAGTAHLTSLDPSDRLPADGPFAQGVRTVSLAFVTAAGHSASVSEVSGTIHADTSTVAVVAGDAVLLSVSGPSAIAGAAFNATVAAKDGFGNVVQQYAGKVALTSSDPKATVPLAYTFVSDDHGQHDFPVTLATAGSQTVRAADESGVAGVGGITVAPAAASTCAVADLPDQSAAGAQVGLKVIAKDLFDNVATGFAGTIAITSSDGAAQLGASGTYVGSDAGARAFSVQLRTAGVQTVTATDTGNASLHCQGSVNVVPGATLLVVSLNGLSQGLDAWAGTAVSATVRAQDAFANRVGDYAGTVTFTSSDGAAARPGNITFAPTDNGQKDVSVTFNTVGPQTLTAADTASALIRGTSSAAAVHGLVYTDPSAGGKVRLVLNGAASSASLVQLDLVSNASLFPSTLGTNDTVRNGAFAAGMNLPLDATKVGPDATLLSITAPPASSAVLNLGSAASARAMAAFLSATNNVLYSGVSQKRVDPTAAAAGQPARRGDVAVRPFPGASSFYYSLRLRLTSGAAPGTVFDGQALSSKFHAAVRDRSGSDVFSNADFAIGKLEVR
jgi:hypothetical protein